MRSVILIGDARQRLTELPTASVSCCLTSPPYWQLRDYGVAGQIGQEPSIDGYVSAIVSVMDEVRRVLHPTGTLWLNLGDSYLSTWSCNRQNALGAGACDYGQRVDRVTGAGPGAKEGDLAMIPSLVALALRSAGWYLRSAIPWVKTNGMPESVTSRPTSSVEWIYLFAKSPNYYYDPISSAKPSRHAGRVISYTEVGKHGAESDPRFRRIPGAAPNLTPTQSAPDPDPDPDPDPGEGLEQATFHDWHAEAGRRDAATIRQIQVGTTRRRRQGDWLRESLEPNGLYVTDIDVDAAGAVTGGDPLALMTSVARYRDAHYATFPPRLVEPIIRAGTSDYGCCPTCLAPWRRVIERVAEADPSYNGSRFDTGKTRDHQEQLAPTQVGDRFGVRTMGWSPMCQCPDAEPVPGVMLDPFAGAGTVGLVARRLGRDCIMIETNEDYAAQAAHRIESDSGGGLFAPVELRL